MPSTSSPSAPTFATEKQEIDRLFPPGRFVAFEAGRVVVDAGTHRQLVEALAAQGKSPHNLVILQAGADYPETAVIFSAAPVKPCHG